MDQDSGRVSQRSASRRDGHARPKHQLDDQPPAGTASPLPRRSAQEHMEPQLRRGGGSVSGKGPGTGIGTPFNPFDPFAADDSAGVHASGATSPEPADEAAAAAEKTRAAAEKTRAAAFNRGSRRGRRRTDPPAG